MQFLDLLIELFQTAFCKCQGEKCNLILKISNYCFFLVVAFRKQRLVPVCRFGAGGGGAGVVF